LIAAALSKTWQRSAIQDQLVEGCERSGNAFLDRCPARENVSSIAFRVLRAATPGYYGDLQRTVAVRRWLLSPARAGEKEAVVPPPRFERQANLQNDVDFQQARSSSQ
jgi:hypothetical protein